MPFDLAPDASEARITDIGRNLMARSAMQDVSFKLVGFDVGHGGYSDTNPVLVEPIDTGASTLIQKFFPPSGHEGFVNVERPHPDTLVLNCRLGHSEPANIGAIGELGIWAEIIESSVPSEIGTKLLFAIAHFPIMVKNLQNVFVMRILIQL